MPYRMSGRFFEACDCFVACPCWFDENPTEDECTGIVAWQIENGEIEGIDVTGLSAVSVSRHGGNRGQSHHMRVLLLLDQDAAAEQHDAMSRAFSGDLGGPLGELARVTGDMAGIQSAKIAFVADGDATRLEAPRRVTVRSKVIRGSTRRPITIGDGLLATLLGTPGVVGRSSRFRLRIDAADIDIDVADRSTTSGRFSYSHSG